jgi:hypothetical protein
MDTVMLEKPLMSFDHLSEAASSLNKATDELSKTISDLDVALYNLNIGLTVWVPVVRWDDPDDRGGYESEQLGYAKVEGEWSISIRRLEGHDASDEPDHVRDIWMFNKAPREARLRAVEKLPLLVDELGKSAIETAHAVNKKLVETKAFTAALGLRSKVTK